MTSPSSSSGPAAGDVLVLVGTMKGAFLFRAGRERREWEMAGPWFQGEPIYALAYDGRRDLVWVTLTGRDEVVGLGVAGGEPVIVHRVPTVHQPDAVAVDPVSGRVYVVSASGAGLQVIDPERVVQ